MPSGHSKDPSLHKAGHDSTRYNVTGSSHQPCSNALACADASTRCSGWGPDHRASILHGLPLQVTSAATLCQRKGKSGWLCCWWKAPFIVAPAHCLSMCLQCCPAPVQCRNSRHRADAPCVVGLAHPIEIGAGIHAGTLHECACTRKHAKMHTRRPCIGIV